MKISDLDVDEKQVISANNGSIKALQQGGKLRMTLQHPSTGQTAIIELRMAFWFKILSGEAVPVDSWEIFTIPIER